MAGLNSCGHLPLLLIVFAGLFSVSTVIAGEPAVNREAYWVLLHEPAVEDELKLTSAQATKYRQTLDRCDLKFFPLRSQTPAALQEGIGKLLVELQPQLKSLLTAPQRQRLRQLEFWRTGVASILFEDSIARLKLSETQRKKIRAILDETEKAVGKLEQQLRDGGTRETLEKDYSEAKTDEQTRILKILTATQKTAWKDLLGQPFDVSKLGQAKYKVPELVDSGEWINGTGQSLAKLHGKVVIVHFYACGCINCIHNYPWYHEWFDRFRNKPVAMIGIHTPETDQERDLSFVRQKAADEKFQFPVLLDVKSENWKAWGNSMWPCVYVIDQEGYLRCFWPGELKWKGTDGELFMRQRIEYLLENPPRDFT